MILCAPIMQVELSLFALQLLETKQRPSSWSAVTIQCIIYVIIFTSFVIVQNANWCFVDENHFIEGSFFYSNMFWIVK
jgi:hypothetical protein